MHCPGATKVPSVSVLSKGRSKTLRLLWTSATETSSKSSVSSNATQINAPGEELPSVDSVCGLGLQGLQGLMTGT